MGALRGFTHVTEDIFQTVNLLARLFKVFVEGDLQVIVRSGPGHLRQRFYQLRFRAVQVAQFVKE
jgi:hypothetical protein